MAIEIELDNTKENRIRKFTSFRLEINETLFLLDSSLTFRSVKCPIRHAKIIYS